MKEERLLDAIGQIDDTLQEEAEADVQKRKKKQRIVMGIVSAAACVCLVAVGMIAALPRNENTMTTDTVAVEEAVAWGFRLTQNDPIVYFPIAFDERMRYGLIVDDTMGLVGENVYEITEDDLGEHMGTVGECENQNMIGCDVYHFASFPDYDSICIVDTPNGYAFYTANWLELPDEIGQSSNVVMEAYGLPDSLETMQIQMPDQTPLHVIEDQATIDAIFAILCNHTNSGLQANEQRFAQAWYDVYGNDDVYYSEEDGCCMFRATEEELQAPQTHTYTTEDGTVIVAQENTTSPQSNYDLAREIWDKGERLIVITTDRGFSFYIDYFPSIRTFIWQNGYYEMTDAEVEQMNQLLQIEELL